MHDVGGEYRGIYVKRGIIVDLARTSFNISLERGRLPSMARTVGDPIHGIPRPRAMFRRTFAVKLPDHAKRTLSPREVAESYAPMD